MGQYDLIPDEVLRYVLGLLPKSINNLNNPPPYGQTSWFKASGIVQSGSPPNLANWNDATNYNYNLTAQGGHPAVQGAGINGNVTVDFDGTNTGLNTNLADYTIQNLLGSTYFDVNNANAFTLGAVFKYTGVRTFDTTNTNWAVNPAIVATTSATNPPQCFGLCCGLKSGDSTKLQVGGWIAQAGNIRSAQAADVDATKAHYAFLIYFQDNLSIYLDGNPVVTTGGLTGFAVGDLVKFLSIGSNGASSNSRFVGSIGEVMTYDRPISPAELTVCQQYFQSAWGLP